MLSSDLLGWAVEIEVRHRCSSRGFTTLQFVDGSDGKKATCIDIAGSRVIPIHLSDTHTHCTGHTAHGGLDTEAAFNTATLRRTAVLWRHRCN